MFLDKWSIKHYFMITSVRVLFLAFHATKLQMIFCIYIYIDVGCLVRYAISFFIACFMELVTTSTVVIVICTHLSLVSSPSRLSYLCTVMLITYSTNSRQRISLFSIILLNVLYLDSAKRYFNLSGALPIHNINWIHNNNSLQIYTD